jgi:hypothetical protein
MRRNRISHGEISPRNLNKTKAKMETETVGKPNSKFLDINGFSNLTSPRFYSFSLRGIPIILVKMQSMPEFVMHSEIFHASLPASHQPIRRLCDTLGRNHEKTPLIQTAVVLMCLHVPIRTISVVICGLEFLGYSSRVRKIMSFFLSIGYRSSRARGDISQLSSEEVMTSLFLRGG